MIFINAINQLIDHSIWISDGCFVYVVDIILLITCLMNCNHFDSAHTITERKRPKRQVIYNYNKSRQTKFLAPFTCTYTLQVRVVYQRKSEDENVK